MSIFLPDSEAELAAWLAERRQADPSRPPPAVTGGSPSIEEWWTDRGPDEVVSMAHLAEVPEFRARDLSITVQAGMRVEEIRARVRERGLWFPVEGSGGDPSIGGLVASAPPARFEGTVGPVRRQVLGCRLVMYDGRMTRWGGPVMKNVAGYDVVRLLCGSRGRLGVLTAVTLRLWPEPTRMRCFRLVDVTLEALLSLLAVGPTVAAVVWRWSRDDHGSGVAEIVLTGGSVSLASREHDLERRALDLHLAVEPLPDGIPPGGPFGFGPETSRRRVTSGAFRVTFGRRYLAVGVNDLISRVVAGSEYGLEVYPVSGIVRLEAELAEAAETRSSPAWLTGWKGAGIDPGAAVRVERGGPAEHEAVRRFVPAPVRTLETHLIEAFRGGECPWQADYL